MKEVDIEEAIQERLDHIDAVLRGQAEENVERQQEAEYDELVEGEYARLKTEAEESIRAQLESEEENEEEEIETD